MKINKLYLSLKKEKRIIVLQRYQLILIKRQTNKIQVLVEECSNRYF